MAPHSVSWTLPPRGLVPNPFPPLQQKSNPKSVQGPIMTGGGALEGVERVQPLAAETAAGWEKSLLAAPFNPCKITSFRGSPWGRGISGWGKRLVAGAGCWAGPPLRGGGHGLKKRLGWGITQCPWTSLQIIYKCHASGCRGGGRGGDEGVRACERYQCKFL